MTGGIRGIVNDKEFEVPLANAVVWVAETNAAGKSDDSGHFSFYNLVPGAYTVIVQKDGYERILIADVIVSPGAMTDVSVLLPGEYVDMDEMVVRPLQLSTSTTFEADLGPALGTALSSSLATEIALLDLRAEDVGIMDAVGRDIMSKSGASTAAEAMKLVSGATVQDNKYAVIRGLSDRFVNTRVNSIAMPTADPNVRAVQLDLFQSALIESIRVYKTFMPDLPANTSGGSVDIITRKMPEKKILEWSAGQSYNSQATGNGNFIGSDEGVSLLGTDDGGRGQVLENGQVASVTTSPKGGFFSDPTPEDEAKAALLDAQTRSLGPTIGTQRKGGPRPNTSLGFSLGDRIQLDDETAIGWLATTTYKRSYSYDDNGVDQFRVGTGDFTGFEIPVESGESNENPDPDQWRVEKASEKVKWGIGTLLGFESGDHAYSISYMRTQDTEDKASIYSDSETSETVYWHNQSLIYTERSLESLQIQGVTPIEFLTPDDFMGIEWETPKLSWSLAENEAIQNQPDRRFFSAAYNPTLQQWGSPRKPKNFAERAWREITEENEYYQFDLTIPFSLQEGRDGEIKTGISDNSTLRFYSQDSFFYEAPSIVGQRTPFATYSAASFDILWTDVFLEPERLGYPAPIGVGLDFGTKFNGQDIITNEVNWVIQEFSDDVDYKGTMDISASYVMAELPIFPWLTIVGGARFAETLITTDVDAADGAHNEVKVLNVAVDPETPDFISADAFNSGKPVDQHITLDDLANATIEDVSTLPAVGVIVDVFDNVKFRFNWSETLARPTFKEITPVSQQDHLNGQQFAGNPTLKIARLENYDVRLDWIPGDGQLFSVGAFTKSIDDPIDYAQRPAAGSDPFVIPFNFESGKVDGLEFELRHDLGRWHDWLKPFSCGFNYTWLEASVTVPDRDARKVAELLALRGIDPNQYDVDERRMRDQPESLVNIFLLGEFESTGTSFGIFFNRKGDTLVAGEDANGDDYIANLVAKEYDTLDISISQKIKENWKLSFKVENLLNPDIQEVWQSDYIPVEALARSKKNGVTYSLSISGKF